MSEKKTENRLGEVFKKVASIGLGAAFMTEDAIRSALGDLPVTKDIINGLVESAKQQKNEVVNSIKGEVKNYLSKIDPSQELDRILNDYEIEVNAKLNFKKKKK